MMPICVLWPSETRFWYLITYLWMLISDTYDCDPNPCVNEAACVDLVDDDYSCLCLTGFTGKNCSVGK